MYRRIADLVSATVSLLAKDEMQDKCSEIPEMNGNNSVPLLLGHSRERLVPQDASVSDQDVDTTEGIQRCLDEGVTILSRAYRGCGFATS
jgi:hypothetical protein